MQKLQHNKNNQSSQEVIRSSLASGDGVGRRYIESAVPNQ